MSSPFRTSFRSAIFALLALAVVPAHAALTLSIEMNPNPVRAGEVIVAELTVANDGVSAVNTVTLQATLPAGISSFNANYIHGGATCLIVINNSVCDPTEIVNWTLGTIPAGRAVTVSLPLFVAGATAPGTTITLPGNVLVNAVSTVTANASVVVSTTNALSLTVDEDKDRAVTGELLTYALAYGNRLASASVTGTTLSFPVPAGTTFVSATGGGVFTAGSVQWSLGSLPATQSGQQQVVVSVNNGLAAGSVLKVDTAAISGSSGVPESATASAVTRVATTPPLVLGIEMNPDPVRPGERGIAQLTVSNRSGSPLTGVVLQARVPQGLDSFSANYLTGGATCIVAYNNSACDSTELMNWTLGTIPAGGGVTVSAPVFVDTGTGAGRLLTLEALVNDDASNRAVRQATIAVDSDGPLSLAIDEDKSPAATGDQLTYTLSYGNRASSSSITGTTLNFRVPEGTTFVSATAGGSLSAGNVQWVLGSLAATQSGQQQVVVSVNNGLAAGTHLAVNGGSITGLNSSLVAESGRAMALARVATTPPLVLGIEMNPDPVRPGERGIAQLTVSNRSGSPLTGVVLQARVPQGLDSFSANYLTGGATCIVAYNNSACDSTELMNWTLGTIPAGGGVTVSAPVFVDTGTGAGRLLTLEALVNDDASNRAVRQSTVATDTDGPLSLSVDEDKNPVAPNNVLTYSLAYANRATTSSITGSTLSFRVPEGTTFVSATGGGALSGANVQWSLGSLAATQSGTQQVAVLVNNGLAPGTGLALNGASIAGLNSSLVTEVARATAAGRVTADPALVLGIEMNPDPVRPGERGVAQLTVSNRSGSPLTGVVLQARVPQGLDSFSANYLTGGATCIVAYNNSACDSTELMNWTLGTIPAGGGVTVSAPVFVDTGTGAGRLLVMEALANDDGVNRAVLETAVVTDADNPLTLALHENTDPVPGGSIVQYSLTYGNRAASGSATNTALSFPLPVEGVLLGSSGGAIVGNNIVWNLGSLAAGAGGRRAVTVSVPGSVPVGSAIRMNAAELKGNVTAGVVPDAQRATSATRVEASKPLGLAVTLSPDPVQPTQTLTGTLMVTNNSGGTLTGVVLQARVPTSVNSFSPALLTGGGTCVIAYNNSLCDSTELANWNIGTMVAGASVQVSMPMVVTAGTANGRLITVDARVTDDAGRLSTLEKTALVNPFSDTDADTVAQIFDNCTTLSNASQCDSDFDGFGNRCDADLNNNMFTNSQDATLFRQQLGLPSVAPVFNEADFNCNGFVNSQDMTPFRALLGSPPGPSSLVP